MDSIFARFYEIDAFPAKSDENIKELITQKKVLEIGDRIMFNAEIYQKRIRYTAETFLIEANHRGKMWNRNVRAFIVGLGLGVWRLTALQVLLKDS